jgi:Ca-activated chloride channel family protein
MLENYDNAQTSYNEALNTSEDKLRAKALYNLGNISFKNNKLEEALALYRKALELDPSDDEARYNYEYIKYQKSPPEEKNNDDNIEKEQDENKEKQNDEKKDQENNEDKKQEESNQNDDSSMNDEESEQQPQNQKKSQDLKKAESILDAIKNDEKVMQKQLIQKAKTKKLLKDW